MGPVNRLNLTGERVADLLIGAPEPDEVSRAGSRRKALWPKRKRDIGRELDWTLGEGERACC